MAATLAELLGSYPETLESKLKANTPVKTGNLRRSIASLVGVDNLKIEMLYYGDYVDDRTHFIREVVNAKEVEYMASVIAEAVAEEFTQEIGDIFKKIKK